MKPFFSIILPTFNQAKFLKECIQSVLNQSFENWELLIINNNWYTVFLSNHFVWQLLPDSSLNTPIQVTEIKQLINSEVAVADYILISKICLLIHQIE